MATLSFDPLGTRESHLPPWELAKAYAFAHAIGRIAEHMDTEPADLLGCRVDDFIASQVYLASGEHPSSRAVRSAIKRCKDSSWYPGKAVTRSSGRPPVYSDFVKNEIARVGMEIKRKLKAPTPRRVRARLPQLTKNPETDKPMDNKTMHAIFKARCYDENEDDPWQYLPNPAQDMLPSELKVPRISCARHILSHFHAGSWYGHVAIDPCYSLLPKKLEKLEEQMVAAMGSSKWQSPGSARKGPNARAPNTTKYQKSSWVTRVDWTPIFARDKLRIFVCDEMEAARNPNYPASLCDSVNLGKFIRFVLPGILEQMKEEHGWATIPRTIVHDKASYMVTHCHQRLNAVFAGALEEAAFTSWVGGNHETTSWLVKKWGDVYIHETVIAHIRRLLDNEFTCSRLDEAPSHFRTRMESVQNFMNSPHFARAGGGRGLAGLARQLRSRCEDVIARKGERIAK